MSQDPIETEFGVPIPGRILPESEWARTAIKRLPPPEEGPLDWAAIFGREAPVVLDLGCGNGRYTLLSALSRPDHDHVAVDLVPAVVRYATKRANQRGLHNVRVIVKDAQSFLRSYVAPGSVAEVHIYHPQPYHDPKEARFRLITPAFLKHVHRVLGPGGLFVVQTDSPEYWEYVASVAPSFFTFREQAGPWPDAPEGRSRREILARSRDLPVFRGVGTRRDDLKGPDIRAAVDSLPLPEFVSRGPWEELDALEATGESRPAPRRSRPPGRKRRG
ncbi:tRNA (guanine(46)-N(7))-methyltransferase TrmB [Tautonia plasticadhaerens]|uniref:tRNA (guanine(46)-N(7))-methyltransferase n=1 Tax=Tautonia plasticadhaerens TaxID=2527974 RepID=A0A518H139_9BACT|nr:methyltransferase domain-containing protein [Tautonia plasticadhaerens]QDV34548.1 tRNA (guanine-N(7)-)-methyltransferase [Tautonia plasticadhaerens]